MTKFGDAFVKCCEKTHNLPAEITCVLFLLLQSASLDYYLIANLSNRHLAWIAPDVFNTILLISCIYISHTSLKKRQSDQKHDHSFAWVTWFFINVIVAAKSIIIFNELGTEIEEDDPSFFGPNVLKTTIALSSCIFMLLLITQHDAPLGSERRLYIEEIIGSVVFDLLDTADILEILFDDDTTDMFWNGLREFILAVASMNLLIPTVPLLILSRTHFGYKKLERHLIYAHRLLVVLAVNIPNLLVRFIVWHGFGGAVSPFSLKNIILISITLYEFYLHKKEKFDKHEAEKIQGDDKNVDDQEVPKKYSYDAGTGDMQNANENYIHESFRIQSRIETCL